MNLAILKKYKIGISLIVLTWFIFFAPIISGQYVYFLDDLKIIYYPIETLYAQFQHQWQLPIWANEFGFGQPLLAWGQLGFFTPLHFIMRALFIPPLLLLQISVVSYFLIGSIGMFVFLIRRNLHQAAAALGAITFAYCGFNIGHLNHVNFYTSTMLLPWLLVAVEALINKSTLARATTLAVVASAIAVSGQPQVVLYVYIVAFIVGLAMFIQQWNTKVLLWTVYAGIVAFLLSSFALLPLQEFLPQTERAGGLHKDELFEFSYPPYNTITLALPYFWGGHADYSGPKGFQELAAYTGIIPLLLAGFGLASWRSHTSEKIAGIFLVLLGATLVLGKYSIVYQYLVEHHYITTIGVVGRFVFFFDIGIVLLASMGLHALFANKTHAMQQRLLPLFSGYLFITLIVGIPFWVFATANQPAVERLLLLLSPQNPSLWLILAGIIVPGFVVMARTSRLKGVQHWILPSLVAVTLVYYGWDYNPRVAAKEAYKISPLASPLIQFKEEHTIPARLYAAEHLPVTGNPGAQKNISDFISPLFTVVQPIHSARNSIECLVIPIHEDSPEYTELTVAIRSGIEGPTLFEQIISSSDVKRKTNQKFCLPEILQQNSQDLVLTISSNTQTNMKVFTSPSTSEDQNAYFIRVQNPTPDQLVRSRKNVSVEYFPEFVNKVDIESAIMVRHIQAIAGSSSARWIGALSLKPFREFVDSFFANDSDAFDGDGVHALTRNKKLVDMVGITHFTQVLEYGQTNDPMLDAGYKLLQELDTGESLLRLYQNLQAYPKTFIVPEGRFIPASDEIRFRMRDPLFDPRKVVYISGSTPPQEFEPQSDELQATATITKYTNTQVDIETTSNANAFLVLTDSTSDQWRTFIDDQPALALRANSVFKAAQIPPGKHIVSFRYSSPAVEKSKIFMGIGIMLTIVGYAYQPIKKLTK